jgi:hypothetical protein
MTKPDVTVIIPTVADDRRALTIWRAIESAGPRSGASTRIVVVVNGRRFSETLLGQLRATPAVDCAYLEAGRLPMAIHHGRELVDTEFFAFLDDDDELLENGLRMRLDALRQQPDVAFVATNGWIRRLAGDERNVDLKASVIEADPFGAMVVRNWMTSASGLYRSCAVTAEDFEGMPSYLEWTYVGFRLAGRPFRFLDDPTYRLYDLADSVSKSLAYRAGMIPALQRILGLQLPPHARAGLRRRLGAVHHALSSSFLEERNLSGAWKHHGLSLSLPGGWRYLPYTRKLVLPPVSGQPARE